MSQSGKSMTHRRTFLKAAGSAGLVSASGCVGNLSGGNGPIKIGALLPMSGPFSRTGQENKRGLEIAKTYLDGKILDREFELIYKDNESKPNASVQGAQNLVENQNVDAIIGPASSGNSIATMAYIKEQGNVPLIPTTASSVEAREKQGNCNKYTFFLWPSNRHLVPTGVKFIQQLPNHVDRDIDPKKVHFVSLDYSLGQNNLSLLEEEMKGIGGEVTGSTLVPIGESDWAPYISEISNSNADVVTGVLTWGAAAKFLPQAESYGLTKQKTMMFNSGKPIGQFAASTMPKKTSGWFGTHFYDPSRDTPVNNEFKSLYKKELDSNLLPNSAAGGGFEILRSVAIAMQNSGSTATDDVIGGLEGLEWDSIFGPVRYRESDHQCELDFVGAVRQQGGGDVPEFTVLKEYPNVIGPAKCNV